ncbi:MAG: SdpI family protein [Candidatus Micrarchaeota archaeon]
MGAMKVSMWALIVAAFVIAFYFYPLVPDKVASHWGAAGEVNGYSDKLVGLFLLPCIMLFIVVLFWVIPKIDPLRFNYPKFREFYDRFLAVLIAFMFYLHLLTVYWNTGNTFNMSQALVPAFAVLFFYSGTLIGAAKRNWFVGIRTPWTLSSESVWKKTHDVGGRLFKACGVIALLGLIFPEEAIWFMIVPVLASSAYTFIYSYLEYRKENGGGKGKSGK